MAQSMKSSVAFIRDAFNPYVGVICSDEAEATCQKNHLSFVELLLPFCRLSSEAHIKDASGTSLALQGFAVQFKDANNFPPQQMHGLRMLSDSVAASFNSQKESTLSSVGYTISYPVFTPWYEDYRECFFSLQGPSEYDFLKHFIACIFVVSSSNSDAMSLFAEMTLTQYNQMQQTPAKPPKWFHSDLCKYYILLHDCTESDDARAESVYQSMKSKYGAQCCHLLKINSVTPNIESPSTELFPDPWSNFLKSSPSESPSKENTVDGAINGDGTDEGNPVIDHPLSSLTSAHSPLERRVSAPKERHSSGQRDRVNSIGSRRRPHTRSISDRGCCLSTRDHDRVKNMVHEFIVHALIPWAERVIRSLNEVFLSKKKGGFLKSIFNRAKTGDIKPVTAYTAESNEMLLRRLGDLCFMFQMYETAFAVYHILKKDYEGDKAVMHCAATQEMAALSCFMQGASAARQYPSHYFEEAISVYQKNSTYATKAVILSTEILKDKKQWQLAASQFLKLTGEENDLRSAVFLEQAAYCYISSSPPQIRKFAWYMVLAGHRYSKASQRKQSQRCYHIALQVYDKKSWRLAEDHIGAAISKLCSQLKDYHQALSSVSKLLVESTQNATQQSLFLREYINLYDNVIKQSSSEKLIPEMSVPIIVDNEIIVVTEQFDMSTHPSVYSDDPRWVSLEEACVAQSQGSLPVTLVRSIPSFNRHMKNNIPPRAYLEETIFIRILLHNPLKVNLILSNILVDWRFKGEGEDDFKYNSRANPELVTQQAIPAIELPGLQKLWVLFKLTPKLLGFLNVTAMSFDLTFSDSSGEALPQVHGKISLNVRGPRLNNTIHEKNSVIHAQDKRLFIHVVPPMPKIKVHFQSFPSSLKCAEIVKVPVTITNVGPVALHNLHLACNEPSILCIPQFDAGQTVSSLRKAIKLGTQNQVMQPSETLTFDMWIRAEDVIATIPINFLIYYESVGDNSKPRHRCCRLSFTLTTSQVLRGKCNIFQRTAQSSEELGSFLASFLLDNCFQSSQNIAMEFIITDIVCSSERWHIAALSSAPTGVRVNQSEVALVNASFRHNASTSNHLLSEIKLNTEQVNIPEDVVNGYIFAQGHKSEPDPEVEDTVKVKQHDADIGILWKCFTMNSEGATTESVGLLYLGVNVDEDLTVRARAMSSTMSQTVSESSRGTSRVSKQESIASADHIEYYLSYSSPAKAHLNSRLSVIPVTLILKSYCSERLIVEITPTSTAGEYMWSGKTKILNEIEPQQTKTISLSVTLLKCGVFNLNSLNIKTLNKDVRITGSMPFFLIVE